jgi:hypothetical protein
MQGRMDRWLRLGVVVVAVFCVAALAGCSGKDGTNGLNGTNGTNGTNGLPGPPGTAICFQCHTDDYTAADFIVPIETDYALSRHALTDTYQRSQAGCSRCHTNEGYQKFVTDGGNVTINEGSHIGCFTCHAPHTNQDFRLRKTGATVLDVSGASYNKGPSNTCALCHQCRKASPSIAAADSAITSSRWGPHHGTQASVLSGNAAYAFGGALAGDHPHNTGAGAANGCVDCHMAGVPTEILAGGHTFEVVTIGTLTVNDVGCKVTGCHSSGTNMTTAVATRKATFDAAMQEIRNELRNRQWVNVGADSLSLVNTAHAPTAASDRGALWNYLLLEQDKSKGVHNPTYIDNILAATKTALGLPL